MALSQNTRVIGSHVLAPDQGVTVRVLLGYQRVAPNSRYVPYILTLLLDLELLSNGLSSQSERSRVLELFTTKTKLLKVETREK